MNLQFYFEKLKESEEYKKFIKENPKASPCFIFFSLDKKGVDNKQQFDFLAGKKILRFHFENNSHIEEINIKDSQPSKKLLLNYNLDFDELEDKILDRMEKEGVKKDIQKMMLLIQNIEGKDTITAIIFVSGMGLLKSKIDAKSLNILEFENKSFFDMFKVVRK